MPEVKWMKHTSSWTTSLTRRLKFSTGLGRQALVEIIVCGRLACDNGFDGRTGGAGFEFFQALIAINENGIGLDTVQDVIEVGYIIAGIDRHRYGSHGSYRRLPHQHGVAVGAENGGPLTLSDSPLP